MNNFLIDLLKNIDSYQGLLKDLNEGLSPISTYGIIDENIGHFIYGLQEHIDKQVLLITSSEIKARRIYEDISNLGSNKVELLPRREILFYDMDAHSDENENQRLKIISKLISEEDILVIASLESLLNKIISKDIFKRYIREIKFGQDIDLYKLSNNLIDSGYEKVHMVEGVGQFSVRGGIIDVFSPNSSNPYRIELFDTEVDSIRSFDILSQRSLENQERVIITPAREVLITDEFRKDIIKNLESELKEYPANERRDEKFSEYLEALQENSHISNIDMVVPFIPKKYISSIISYFNKDSMIFLDEAKRLEEEFETTREGFNLKTTELLEAGEAMPSHYQLTYDYQELLPEIRKRSVVTNSSLLRSNGYFKPKEIYNFSVKSTINYHNKIELLVEDLNHYKYRGYKTIILSGTEERGLRLQKNLEDLGLTTSFSRDKTEDIQSNQIFITTGSVQSGFEYSDIKLLVISDREIFGAQKKRQRKRRKKDGKQIVNLRDLEIGSYVVHEDHGIGRYEGIEQLDIQGVKKDYLNIRYRDQDKLYIPIDQMNLIQKYVGSDSAKPRINKLHSGDWQRTKARAKKSVEDMAEELLELYAKRETSEGYAFSKDTPWQRQFEDLFAYEETEGQLESAEEIKKDMENPKPMDRLLCGDVGYGKTEVALRAAFKALMDNKQVAILVPTTILAQQHYNTIIERFKNFPVETALLSRFVTLKKQEVAIAGVKDGSVDIIVGTHRLLSKDIKFKDLGLLIVDEEQRFGVKHKERLKNLKKNVDILTLTATPIPRTLHMSLVGIRDMSVIEEPPEERFPIQTYVVEYNEQMIRDAILKEVDRGGQVYFVYNRVDSINKITKQLRELVPEVEFGIAHGQMGERQLENVMVDFLEEKFQVLVCTTIIETGLDIQNVNTIIVYNADKMGLSQLYQLRGRVGRSNRMAYGYFVYEKNRVLTEVAEKRLRAIKEFSEFGSGFKIAMRDLEIRGAGNLLGLEQHGHIEAIGYDLYVKFLSDTIARLKGEEPEEKLDTLIDVKVDGYIPEKYIEAEEQKIDIYKKIASIDNMEGYREIVDELIDRFGDIPKEVENLIDISYIKSLAGGNRIDNISEINKEIKLDFLSTDDIPIELIHSLTKEYNRRIRFDLSGKPYLIYRPRKDMLKELKELINLIRDFYSSKEKKE